MTRPIVYIRWLDAVTWSAGWESTNHWRKRLRDYPLEHDATGFLIDETDEWVALALAANKAGTSWQQIIRIPRNGIVEQRVVGHAHEEEAA